MRMIHCGYPYMIEEGNEVRVVLLADVGRSASVRRWSCIHKQEGVSKAPDCFSHTIIQPKAIVNSCVPNCRKHDPNCIRDHRISAKGGGCQDAPAPFAPGVIHLFVSAWDLPAGQ